MNWTKIKENFPSAYKKCNDWGIEQGGSLRTFPLKPELEDLLFRSLFDFFDENGIRISIQYEKTPKGDGVFTWAVDPKIDILRWEMAKSRLEAEEGAFLEAFEVLERKL